MLQIAQKPAPEVRLRLEREARRSGFAHPTRGVFELFKRREPHGGGPGGDPPGATSARRLECTTHTWTIHDREIAISIV